MCMVGISHEQVGESWRERWREISHGIKCSSSALSLSLALPQLASPHTSTQKCICLRNGYDMHLFSRRTQTKHTAIEQKRIYSPNKDH